jgi:hypothetical protein
MNGGIQVDIVFPSSLLGNVVTKCSSNHKTPGRHLLEKIGTMTHRERGFFIIELLRSRNTILQAEIARATDTPYDSFQPNLHLLSCQE